MIPAEAKRVEDAGGIVVTDFTGFARVAHTGYEERVRELRRAQAMGLGTVGKEPVALDVSRALGDRDFKAVTGKALLVSTPDVRVRRLRSSHKFLALVCGGIPQAMDDAEVTRELDLVREMEDPVADIRAGCGALVQEAYGRGSVHNLTVIMVRIQWSPEAKYERKIAKIEKAKEAALGVDESKQASAAAASKRRRLEAAAAVTAQKKASYENSKSQIDKASEAADAARKEIQLKKMQAEVEAERREVARKAVAEAARKAREEAEREAEARDAASADGKEGGAGAETKKEDATIDEAEAFFIAHRAKKAAEAAAAQAAPAGEGEKSSVAFDAAEAFFAKNRAQKEAMNGGGKAAEGEGAKNSAAFDAAEDFFAKNRAQKAAADAGGKGSAGSSSSAFDAAEAFFARNRAEKNTSGDQALASKSETSTPAFDAAEAFFAANRAQKKAADVVKAVASAAAVNVSSIAQQEANEAKPITSAREPVKEAPTAAVTGQVEEEQEEEDLLFL